MIALVVIHGGESRFELLRDTIESARSRLHGTFGQHLLVVDPCSREYETKLRDAFPEFTLLAARHRRGLTVAIAEGRNAVRSPYWFQLEDDFTFNRDVFADDMVEVMRAHTHLAQLVLKRQPWNELEIAAGGIVEMWPHEYTDCTDGTNHWLEHTLFWSNNPSLNRGSLTRLLPSTEAGATVEVRALGMRMAFWGERSDDPWVTHRGDVMIRTDG